METELAAFNPWLDIWYRPRSTIRLIVRHHANRYVWLFSILLMFNSILDRQSFYKYDAPVALAPLFFLILVLSLVTGPILLFLTGLLIGELGRRLGGLGANEDVRTALMRSAVPKLAGMLFWIPQVAIFRDELFTKSQPTIDAEPLLFGIEFGFVLLSFVLAGWQAVLTVLTIAEVHQFSVWRAVPTVFFPALMLSPCFLLPMPVAY